MTLNLPPPTVFAHKETLHAIELPPLATFLNTLSTPDHLLKLNDILLRYRTPKSYHRLDVREISSSELPLSSPEPEDAGYERRAREKLMEKGEPVILDEGDSVEGYKTRREPGPSREGEVKDTIEQNGHGLPTTRGGSAMKEKGENATHNNAIPADTRLTSHIIDHNESRTKSPTPPTTVRPTKRLPSPPTHHLPPTGPKRRIRELRLDLRTLDAAALFALETWRRELMGLDKLEMQHPDSIWYKDATPTPTPSPSPEPEPVPVKRKRGRPPSKSIGKSQSRTPAAEEAKEDNLQASKAEPSPEVGRRRSGRPRRSGLRGSQSETPAMEEKENQDEAAAAKLVGDVEQSARVEANVIPEVDGDVERADGEVQAEDAPEYEVGEEKTQDIEAFDILVDGPANQEPTSNDVAAAPEHTNQATSEIDDLESLTAPASPDIILVDGFNRHDSDSDFSPERSPSPVQKPVSTNKKSPFQPAPPPIAMAPGLFQAAPPPVAMTINSSPAIPIPVASSSSIRNTGPEPRASASWFQDAPPPVKLGSSSRKRHHEASVNDEEPFPLRRTSHGRPLSLSPTRPPIPLQRQSLQEGGTSDSPFTIPDSPEKRDTNIAFIPFVREQMRIPTFAHAPVVPTRGLHWHQSDNGSNKAKRKEREVEAESRPKVRRRSSIAKVHFAEKEEEEEDEVIEQVEDRGRQGQKRRAGDSDDDEWADFRF